MHISPKTCQKPSAFKPHSILAVITVLCFAVQGYAQEANSDRTPGSGLHIIPDHVGDSHFTAGPCPDIVPPDGAACPNGATTCAAFYNPAILPAGYNSVSYCASVPAGIGFNASGYTLLTKPLNTQEQEAFLKAAKKVESYVKDDVTVVIEPYKVDYLDSNGNNNIFFGGNEYWNPVCGADALLPPFTNESPTIIENPDGSYSYQNLPQTYDTVLQALKHKNAANESPMKLINYLPSYDEINVEWPPTFLGWQDSTDVASDLVSNFLVEPNSNYPVTPDAKPFTLCDAPAAMKMLGFAPMFNVNGHNIDDINSPAYNMNVTLAGTDGALVIPDTSGWMYDSTASTVVNTQLPKAYFESSLNVWLPQVSCADPTQCRFPEGVNGGGDLIGVFNHELNHILGLMQSQYYKVSGEETSLAYTYGTALFPLDLFDLDSDYVVPGYGHKGIETYSDFKLAPRNNNTYEPTTIYFASSAAGLTPFTQFGFHDHAMVYDVRDGEPHYFPLQNYSVTNPDGDVQFQNGFVYDSATSTERPFFVDPLLVNLDPLDVVYPNVQSGASPNATVYVDTIREYSELAAEGWNINYSTLKDPYHTRSPLAKWYETCFDSSGAFTTSQNSHCKFSVLPGDLKFLNAHFDLTVDPPSETLTPGNSAIFILKINSEDDFSGQVNLSCSGGPPGSKCILSPQSVPVNSWASVASMVQFPKDSKAGTYTVTFAGTSGSLSGTTSASFTLK
jgi:hypothetical protein